MSEEYSGARESTPRHETLIFQRLRSDQERAADAISGFAGSMAFVYAHVVWFGGWIVVNVGLLGSGLVFDAFPFGLLTLVVSLEAIFLSTFVMISQNREASRAEVRAQLDFETNLRTEVLVEMLAEHAGVDLQTVRERVAAEDARVRRALANPSSTPSQSG